MLRQVTMAGAAVMAVSACSTSPDSSDERTAGVYAAVIRAVAEEGPADFRALEGHDDRVVYAGPLGDEVEIPLEVQVAVVEALRENDYATVRFVDDWEEAVDTDDTTEPVLEEGVLVLLGEVPEDGTPLAVDVQLYVNSFYEVGFAAEVTDDADVWSAVVEEQSGPAQNT
jgi:hypothetical protein